MIQPIFIAFLFVTSVVLQASFISVLPTPFNLFPLHLIIGSLLLNRMDSIYGPLWFLGGAAILPFFDTMPGTAIAYLLTAMTGWFLERRFFASRSIYALVGLGAAVYLTFTSIRTILTLIDTGGLPIQMTSLFYGLLFMIIGVCAVFFAARAIEHSRSRFVLIRYS